MDARNLGERLACRHQILRGQILPLTFCFSLDGLRNRETARSLSYNELFKFNFLQAIKINSLTLK